MAAVSITNGSGFLPDAQSESVTICQPVVDKRRATVQLGLYISEKSCVILLLEGRASVRA